MTLVVEYHHAWTEGGKCYWNVRNRIGEFCRLDGSNSSDRTWLLLEWHAYLDARYATAEGATRGHLLSRAGRRRNVSASGLVQSGSLLYASPELKEWLGKNGPALSFEQFSRMVRK